MSNLESRSLFHRAGLLAIIAVAFGLTTIAQAGAGNEVDLAGEARAAARPVQFRDDPLNLEERVRCQRAIEEVYWRHRIWPAENPGPKPTLDEVLPDAVIRARVTKYLEKSAALEIFWSRPLTGDQLQAEVNRMVRDTKNPELLRELLAALHNDPLLVAECLARPVLVDRLVHNWDARDAWWTEEGQTAVDSTLRSDSVLPPFGGYQLPSPLESGCTADTWNGLWYAPVARAGHTSVWTGTELIVWGGQNGEFLNTGGRYDPATDSWTETSTGTGVPSARYEHTAVWTGTEMIVWGGHNTDDDAFLNTGGRYDPGTDSWTATSTGTGAPTGRIYHTTVWTGTEMIVWGGDASLGTGGLQRTGGRYDPATDSWSATWTGLGVPTARQDHTAVWTGTEMIVWGGDDDSGAGGMQKTGGRYDPVSNRWSATPTSSGVPRERSAHTAVWTGTEMIVWGGYLHIPGEYPVLNTGGRYDPVTDAWVATSIGELVPTVRIGHTAVWTGAEMVVWGGYHDGEYLDTGGRYDPVSDLWTSTSTGAGALPGRRYHTAVWTGAEMIVWGGDEDSLPGGYRNTGGRYDTATDSWTATSTGAGVPTERSGHTAVWTGAEMIVWGGDGGASNTGGRYDPATDSWSSTSTGTGVPTGRERHTAVWTGEEMIVWGGYHSGNLNTGGRYDPTLDRWDATSTGISVPAERSDHTAVWTGSEMIVWGGTKNHPNLDPRNTGGRYDPATDSWTATSTSAGVPTAREQHTAIWTGAEMIVWGGLTYDGNLRVLDTGGRYDPATDSWSSTSTEVGLPTPRRNQATVWTGAEMIVWGGHEENSSGYLDTGGRYDPATDSWSSTSTGPDLPTARTTRAAVWTGTEMIVWGGYDGGYLNTGGRYDPAMDSWSPTSTAAGVPMGRSGSTAVWTGTEMIVWGGNRHVYVNSGGLYCACDEATVSTWYPDADGDGFGVESTGIASCAQPPGYVASSGDCDDFNPDIYPGAVEINDGLDNQCAGEIGHGLVDEISSVCGFHNPMDPNEFSCPLQVGATRYEVVRSPHPEFPNWVGCLRIVSDAPSWVDSDPVPAGTCLYYLVRSHQPHTGSWGADSGGIERTITCHR